MSCLTCQGSRSLDIVPRSMKESLAQAGVILCSFSEPRGLQLTQGFHFHFPFPERCSLDGWLPYTSFIQFKCLLNIWNFKRVFSSHPIGNKKQIQEQRTGKKGTGKRAGIFVLEDKGMPLDREETEGVFHNHL